MYAGECVEVMSRYYLPETMTTRYLQSKSCIFSYCGNLYRNTKKKFNHWEIVNYRIIQKIEP